MIAVCFYTSDSYEELRKVADDKKVLCDTYADWLVEFSTAVNGIKGEGVEVIPVTINISDLVKWCKQNKSKNTTSNRAKYVAELSKIRYGNSK